MLLKGILFDLDGVITDTATYHLKAWQHLANLCNLTLDAALESQLKGVSRIDAFKLILAHNHSLDRFSQAQIKQLCDDKNDYYQSLIRYMTQDNILPGISEFLISCQKNKIKMAITSASFNAPQLLDSIGLTHYFDHIVDPATLVRGKPDPDIFLKGAHALGLLPSDCIGIEDAVAGIRAINAAGSYSVGIGDKHALCEAKLVLPTTAALSLTLFT